MFILLFNLTTKKHLILFSLMHRQLPRQRSNSLQQSNVLCWIVIHKPPCPAKGTAIYTRFTGILSLSPIIGLQSYDFSFDSQSVYVWRLLYLWLFNIKQIHGNWSYTPNASRSVMNQFEDNKASPKVSQTNKQQVWWPSLFIHNYKDCTRAHAHTRDSKNRPLDHIYSITYSSLEL